MEICRNVWYVFLQRAIDYFWMVYYATHQSKIDDFDMRASFVQEEVLKLDVAVRKRMGCVCCLVAMAYILIVDRPLCYGAAPVQNRRF